MFDKARAYISNAIVSTGGTGASSTKLIYVATGLAGLLCSVLMSLVFCAVYLWKRVADPSFAAALGAMWAVAYGFVTSAHNKKNTADKEIAMADSAGGKQE